MLTRRFVLSGLIAAPAVIAADKLMPVHSLPQRYATVWGVGHDLEVVEHVIWEPTSIMAFGMSNDMDKFREVTAWEYGFPVKPMPKPINWRIDPTPDPLARFRNPERIAGTPFWPAGYTPSTMYALAEDMGPSARVGIWDPHRAVKDDGFTRIMGYQEMNTWRESLRPDLDGRDSVEWIQEQIKAERKFLGS